MSEREPGADAPRTESGSPGHQASFLRVCLLPPCPKARPSGRWPARSLLPATPSQMSSRRDQTRCMSPRCPATREPAVKTWEQPGAPDPSSCQAWVESFISEKYYFKETVLENATFYFMKAENWENG